MTGNVVTALLMGMVVTMVIQSSSATTVMVVGFVNAGIMTLKQSVGVILGANIGTIDYRADPASVRRRGQRQPVHGSAKPKNLAYIIVLVGVIIMMLAKSAVPAISRISSPVSVFCSSACRSWRARLHRWLICRSSRICSLLSPIRCSVCWSARALPRSSSRPPHRLVFCRRCLQRVRSPIRLLSRSSSVRTSVPVSPHSLSLGGRLQECPPYRDGTLLLQPDRLHPVPGRHLCDSVHGWFLFLG